MKKPLSQEILTDYLFELLEDSDKNIVEEQLRNCPESKKRLVEVRTKFAQLQKVKPEQSIKSKKAIISTIACAAAILLIYSIKMPLPKTSLNTSFDPKAQPSKKSPYLERTFQLEFFSEKKDTFSLLSKLEAPLKETIDLKIPKVRIEYDDENYKIVDLKNYQSLNLPSEFLEGHPNNFEQILSLK